MKWVRRNRVPNGCVQRQVLSVLLLWSAAALAGGGSDWVNPGTGSWNEPDNWIPARVPDANFGDEPTIDNGGTAQVVGIAPPTFDLLTVGENNSGTLEISAGGALESDSFAIFGRNAGSSGALILSGTGSSLTLFREMRIGRLGTATLVIENGAALTSNTSGSTVDTIIAENTGAVGSVTVRGVGSIWQANNDLRIAMPATGAGGASGGTASLTMIDGGVVNSQGGTLASGVDADASVKITGAGSRWDATEAVIFIGAGTADVPAALTAEQGGRISARDIVINPSGPVGNRRLVLGTGAAPGILDIERVFGAGSGGGLFVINHNEPEYWLTRDGTSTGTPVTLAAGLQVRHAGPGTTVLDGSSEFSGSIEVENGSFVVIGQIFAGQFIFESTITVSGDGVLGGDGQVANVEVADGTVSPGRSVGMLSTRNLTLNAASTLAFELGEPGSGDRLEVNGNLVLDGEIDIVDAGGFAAGRYRLINYQGSLTDNGLTIGAAPAGLGIQVDTSVVNQVDLVVSSNSASAIVLPEHLRFPNIEPGQTSSPEPVIVASDGTLPLIIQSISIEGSAAAYTLTEDLCSGQTLAVGETCDLTMVFAPGGLGLKLARLEILSNDIESPAVVPLSGIAVVADALFADSFD